MPFHAHTAEDNKGNPLPEKDWQLLKCHLLAVANLARDFANRFKLDDPAVLDDAFLVGLIHDLGKYRAAFQQYLRKQRRSSPETHHAIYGALLACASDQAPAAFAIAGHHAGLHDLPDLQSNIEHAKTRDDPDALFQLLKDDLREAYPGVSIPFFPDQPARMHIARAEKDSETAACLATEFYTRMLFSCLVDADRFDSAYWPPHAKTPSTIPLNPAVLLERVLAGRDRKRAGNPGSPLAATRNSIFDACLEAGKQPPGFFSLTVPTGGGKTLASMAFALAHAQAHGLRRIIVVIPYLSIIEQNAAEYRRILDPENAGVVLESHSSAKPRNEAADEELSLLELVSENWDAPVVVTTSVQFVESLFAASPTRARKLHNIARSIVIFDEVQTLPTHLLSPMFSVFRELAGNYGVSFVFSSATQPAFRRSASSLCDGFAENELREIAPDPKKLFHQLRRVSYRLLSDPLGWPALAGQLAAAPQVLCVVNLTRHARELWIELSQPSRRLSENERPIHLSSAMCPAHRLALIRRIRQRLKAGLPCRVVSTQLVEAGVDLDFPAVWRAMGPLDSIVQVAGRCNREGRHPASESIVHVFTPEDNKLPPGIYSTATDQTAVSLARLGAGAPERLTDTPGIFGDYFDALFGVTNTDYARRGENTIQEEREKLHFRKVAEKAKVIEDSGTPVIVPIGGGKHLVDAIRNRASQPVAGQPRFTRDDLRRLQRYMVNVRDRDFLLMEAHGFVQPLLPNLDLFVLKESHYNYDLGFLPDGNQPPLDFL